MLRGALRSAYRLSTRISPKNSVGDKFCNYLLFLSTHGRRPKDVLLFNDYLHKMKTSGELGRPLRVYVTDKEFSKRYICEKLGDKYIIPTFGLLKNKYDIRNFEYPIACCIKPTHASGKVFLRNDGEPIDFDEIESWLTLNYYAKRREVNYRDLEPKIMVEPHININQEMREARIFCYNGSVRLILLNFYEQGSIVSRKFFDADWREQPFSLGYPRNEQACERPANLDEMLEVATRLSADFSFLRVDLYSDGSAIRVGELTNCHAGASQSFVPPAAEALASRLIFGGE